MNSDIYKTIFNAYYPWMYFVDIFIQLFFVQFFLLLEYSIKFLKALYNVFCSYLLHFPNSFQVNYPTHLAHCT